MGWAIGALVLIGAVVLGSLVLMKTRARAGDLEPDPLFIVGIPLAGTGAALVVTTPPVAAALIAVGLALIVTGAIRSVDSTQ